MSGMANHGLHIESGMGVSFILYASGSTGVGFSLDKPGDSIATATTCRGIKLDISVEVSFSVSRGGSKGGPGGARPPKIINFLFYQVIDYKLYNQLL